MADERAEIVIIEDNPNDLELKLHALKMNHPFHEIFVARDGEEALNYFFTKGDVENSEPEQTVKLIFLDIKLPKIDGLEVLRRIKESPRTKGIPVVVLTSSQQERDMRDAYNLGVNSYIVKPIDFLKFIETFRVTVSYWLEYNHLPNK